MPNRYQLTQAGARFAAKWIENKYWQGVPALKAMGIVKGHLGLNPDPIGQKLEDRRYQAHARERVALSRLKMAGQWLEACQSNLMSFELANPGRDSYHLYCDLTKAQVAVNRRRVELRQAAQAHVLATRQFALWCQGYMCNA